ncbi:hypothetical protein PPL_11343 [Heterostelium album PN500]|uniref:HMA domain-containing protein n=1 Tax=Heterostelium pallidum (strain ATCC 26659 / Pp 5 / PN500) TaxID=670386 RepID=D3BT51_HETP5|nr:hypothetical protein PPL_11343 [Heterostelium album PN500]EFA75268.1 hypothetical protein PPL_11343 [Heterostelium album PN500]|eukprot:XP_020427402.1 hypothetical protein PPL_11343 [Heterostelium album PN500]
MDDSHHPLLTSTTSTSSSSSSNHDHDHHGHEHNHEHEHSHNLENNTIIHNNNNNNSPSSSTSSCCQSLIGGEDSNDDSCCSTSSSDDQRHESTLCKSDEPMNDQCNPKSSAAGSCCSPSEDATATKKSCCSKEKKSADGQESKPSGCCSTDVKPVPIEVALHSHKDEAPTCKKGCCSTESASKSDEVPATNQACKKGCCSSSESSPTTPATTVQTEEEQQPKKDNCKKGCCSSKKAETVAVEPAVVAVVVEEPKKDNCKKGCCSSKKAESVVVEQPVVVAAVVEEPKKDNCKKGCCSSKKAETVAVEPVVVAAVVEEPKKDNCKKGCCSSKKAESVVVEQPAVVAAVVEEPKKDNCKKGCCSSKKTETVEPVVVAAVVEEPKKDNCQKGCCSSKKTETVAAPEATQTVPKKEDCKKGCCPPKNNADPMAIPTVVITTTSTVEKPGEDCKKGCCPPKKEQAATCSEPHDHSSHKKPHSHAKKVVPAKTVQKKCCDICLESPSNCCKKGCCETKCCLTIEVGYGGKDSLIPTKTKKTLSASVVYRKCGNFFGLRFGYKQEEPEEEMIDLEVGGERKQVTLSLEPSGLTCCSECLNNVDTKIKTLPGIFEISTNLYTLKSTIDYNDGLVSVDEMIEVIKSIGVNATEVPPADIDQLRINTEGKAPSIDLMNQLKETDGVIDVVNETSGARYLSISYDSETVGPRDLYDKVQQSYQADNESPVEISLVDDNTMNNAKQNSINSINSLRRLLIISIILCIPVVVLSFFIPNGNRVDNEVFTGLSIRHFISWVLTTPIQFYIGLPMYQSAYKSIRFYKRANMDLLVMLSTSIAYFYSILSIILNAVMKEDFPVFFETSAILLTLIILGRFLETLARGQASNTLTKLISLQPSTAILAKDERVVDVRLVQKGDIVRILPFSRVPLDGAICENYEAFLDQSAITGESVNVHKQQGDLVFSGSINQSTAFQMKVSTQSSRSTIANICRLVEQCQSNKAPVAMQADRVASIFVPIIIVIACVVFAAWMISSRDFTFSLLFSMSVMVIACPCAVALSTPTAVMVGSGVGARNGIIFKGGEVMQKCHNIDTVVFDKTGTLTNGKLNVTNHITFNGASEQQLFYYLGSAEMGSEHIIGKTLVEVAKTRFECQLTDPMDVKIVPGRGLRCTVDGLNVLVGNKKFIHEDELVELDENILREIRTLESEGKTVTIVALSGSIIGVIGMMDTLRDESVKIVKKLKSMGMDIWIMSGDNTAAVSKIAQELGVTGFFGEATPASKAESIKELQTKHRRKVAMIGDGVNDAVALVQADVGIAVSNGTDVALEAASIVLMRPDLEGIVNAITLSRLVFLVIKINLSWSFLYNFIGIPLAAGALYPVGFTIPPAFAGLSELLSSLPVVVIYQVYSCNRRKDICKEELI